MPTVNAPVTVTCPRSVEPSPVQMPTGPPKAFPVFQPRAVTLRFWLAVNDQPSVRPPIPPMLVPPLKLWIAGDCAVALVANTEATMIAAAMSESFVFIFLRGIVVIGDKRQPEGHAAFMQACNRAGLTSGELVRDRMVERRNFGQGFAVLECGGKRSATPPWKTRNAFPSRATAKRRRGASLPAALQA